MASLEVSSTFSEPLCLGDAGAVTGEITFRAANIGAVRLRQLSIVDERTVSTAGGMLFLRLLVCPTQPGVCEFRTDAPENLAACRFDLAEGESFTCSISQTVTSTARSFGESATLSGVDACDNPVQASAVHVTHVGCAP